MQKNLLVLVQLYLWGIGYFFPVNAQWEEKSPMPVPLTGVSAVNFDDKIYLIGGKNLNVYHDRVHIYDPRTDSWDTSSTARLGNARSNAACTVYDDRIYVIGGRDNKGALKTVEVFDPDSNVWKKVDDIKGPRDGATANVFNDSLLVIGGVDNEGAYIEKIEYYDLSRDTWVNSGSKLSPSRAGGLSAMREDTIWIFGGFYFSPLSSSLKFTPSKLWSAGPELTVARGEGAAVILGDSILLIGGESATGAVPLVELYNIKSGVIEPGFDLPGSRAGHAAVVSDGKAFIFGGHGESTNNILRSVLCFEFTPTSINQEVRPEIYLPLDAYPNPFNGETRIRFTIKESTRINLTIYDGRGKKVRTMFDGQLNQGMHQIYWNGSSDGQSPVASGIYFLCLRTGDHLSTRKLVYIR